LLAVKKALKANAFGKNIVYSTYLLLEPDGASYYKNSWHGTKDLDGGILFTQFSHFIDLLYWFFGDVKKVSAITKNAASQILLSLKIAVWSYWNLKTA
jgi:UDP-N-acetyl-2-amino-2-deoxyglucuronate dehydrogenase